MSAAIMNTVIHHITPLSPEYPLSSEQDCIDSIGAHAAAHSHYASGTVPDQLRRDTGLNPSAPHPYQVSSTSASARYISRAGQQDSQYPPGAGISDSYSGSISTSPSSNGSSIPYPSFANSHSFHPTNLGVGHSYSSNHHAIFSSPPYSILGGQRPGGLSLSDHPSTTGMLPPTTRSSGMGNPVSPSMSASARENYITSTPHVNRHSISSPRGHAESLSRPIYGSHGETPRSITQMTLSPSSSTDTYGNHAASMLSYGPSSRHSDTPPFSSQETFFEITCDNQMVTPTIDAKIEKGFFYSTDHTWTCYRRNYFSVLCSFSLNPNIPNGRLLLMRQGKGAELIQALAVSLSAAIDEGSGKTIELVQHTPKRDKGPQLVIRKERLLPTPPGKSQNDSHGYPYGNFSNSAPAQSFFLPLQGEADPPPKADHANHYPSSNQTSGSHTHTFERIQFKSATANNGKRRAQQQYYHLIVELWADVRPTRDHPVEWVKVAQRASASVVVRGRSPSHYQNEGPHSTSSRGAGGGAGSGAGGTSYGPPGAAGGGSAAARGLTTSSLTNVLSGSTGSMGGGMYRHGHYPSLTSQSPHGSHSVSSSSSVSGGVVAEDGMLENGEAEGIKSYAGYQYMPGPMYESLPLPVKSEVPPGIFDDHHRRPKEEFGGLLLPPAVQVGGCGRFQGMDTSRGMYPEWNTDCC